MTLNGYSHQTLTGVVQPEALQYARKVLERLRHVIVGVGMELQLKGIPRRRDVLRPRHDSAAMSVLLVVLSQHQPVRSATTLLRLEQEVIEAEDDLRRGVGRKGANAVLVGRVVVRVVGRHQEPAFALPRLLDVATDVNDRVT